MTYQPPLIGSKQLLNFHATTWPASAAGSLIAAVALAVVLAVRAWRRPAGVGGIRSPASGVTRPRAWRGRARCGPPGPAPIAFGQVACEHCHMTIADPRFAAELVTCTGKVYVFDDVGCLAGVRGERAGPPRRSRSRPGSPTSATPALLDPGPGAAFLRTEQVRTPMASNLLARAARRRRQPAGRASGGILLAWSQVLAAARGRA